MKKSSIVKIRKELVDELINYEGEPVRFDDLPIKLLDDILFEHYESGKVFAYELNNDNLPCDIIRKIDFTGVSFDGFKCSINFKGIKGVTINPQNVFGKDLSSAIFDGVTFELDERGFDGVHLCNTSFKGARVKDDKPIIINPQTLMHRTLYCCEFDGVVFKGLFDDVDVRCADFTGSRGAVINPQTLFYKNLEGTKLSGVSFSDGFDDVCVEWADFSGSMNAFIDPQKVYDKSLINTNLKDTFIINYNMNGVKLKNTNFAGAKGDVQIDPQKIYNKILTECVFTGVKFIGALDGCHLYGTSFVGSTGAYVNDIETIKYNDSTIFDDVVDMANAYGEINERAKVIRKIKNKIHLSMTDSSQ